MGRFDVYRFNATTPFVVDVQADLLAHLATVTVIPLLPDTKLVAHAGANLSPLLRLAGAEYRLMTTHIAGVRRSMLGARVGSVEDQRTVIVAAIDFLLQGF